MLLISFFFFCSSALLARCVRPRIQIRSEIAHVPPFSSLLVVQLKFPTMMSSLFQTSRLKTVSKRLLIASFPCACVRAVVSAWRPLHASVCFPGRLGAAGVAALGEPHRGQSGPVCVPVHWHFWLELVSRVSVTMTE